MVLEYLGELGNGFPRWVIGKVSTYVNERSFMKSVQREYMEYPEELLDKIKVERVYVGHEMTEDNKSNFIFLEKNQGKEVFCMILPLKVRIYMRKPLSYGSHLEMSRGLPSNIQSVRCELRDMFLYGNIVGYNRKTKSCTILLDNGSILDYDAQQMLKSVTPI